LRRVKSTPSSAPGGVNAAHVDFLRATSRLGSGQRLTAAP
jgi:hypothetical protein